MDIVSLSISLVLYVIGIIAFFVFREKYFLKSWRTLFIWIGFLFHTLAIIFRSISDGGLPLSYSYGIFMTLSWAILLAGLLISSNIKMRMLFVILVCIAFSLILIALHLSKTPQLSGQSIQGFWFLVHVLFCLLSYGAFTLGFLASIFYLLQERQLKHKLVGPLFNRLPDLMSLDRLNTRTILWGMACLSLGLGFGFYWSKITHNSFLLQDPKVLASILLWASYGVMGVLSVQHILQGKKLAIWSLIGYIGVIITFFLVNFISQYHSYL